jgi:hypothetical protein
MRHPSIRMSRSRESRKRFSENLVLGIDYNLFTYLRFDLDLVKITYKLQKNLCVFLSLSLHIYVSEHFFNRRWKKLSTYSFFR